MKPDAIFASNTSTIPITGLAKNSARQKNFIGIHFFSPVDRMMLVEIIMGKKTGDKALAVALDFVRAIKKTPIVVNDTRGFYVNRMRAALHVRSLQDADRGRAGGDDRECRQDVRHAGRAAGADRRDGHRPCPEDHAPDHARHGREGGRPPPSRRWSTPWSTSTAASAARTARASTIIRPSRRRSTSGTVSQTSIRSRTRTRSMSRNCATASIRSSRWKPRVASRKASSPMSREADVGSILGFGFAPFTGGAISYIDGMGAKKFVEMTKALAEEIRPAIQGAETAARDGRKGRELLYPLQPEAGAEAGGVIML